MPFHDLPGAPAFLKVQPDRLSLHLLGVILASFSSCHNKNLLFIIFSQEALFILCLVLGGQFNWEALFV
jgi:hypothetical protein